VKHCVFIDFGDGGKVGLGGGPDFGRGHGVRLEPSLRGAQATKRSMV
jgi:hypothetical protein